MPVFNPYIAKVQSSFPRFLRVRLTRLPILVLFVLSLFTLTRYLGDPQNFNLLESLGLYSDDDDYYDPHLYEWHKYPGAARAGAHHDHDKHDVGASGAGKKKAGPGMDEIGDHHNQIGSLNYTGNDGLVRGWTLEGRSVKNVGKRLTHPIEEIMRENKADWDGMLKRQSRTLEKAVVEYVRRYQRLPPKGFDAWWKYCMDNDVLIVDDVSAGETNESEGLS